MDSAPSGVGDWFYTLPLEHSHMYPERKATQQTLEVFRDRGGADKRKPVFPPAEGHSAAQTISYRSGRTIIPITSGSRGVMQPSCTAGRLPACRRCSPYTMRVHFQMAGAAGLLYHTHWMLRWKSAPFSNSGTKNFHLRNTRHLPGSAQKQVPSGSKD